MLSIFAKFLSLPDPMAPLQVETTRRGRLVENFQQAVSHLPTPSTVEFKDNETLQQELRQKLTVLQEQIQQRKTKIAELRASIQTLEQRIPEIEKLIIETQTLTRQIRAQHSIQSTT